MKGDLDDMGGNTVKLIGLTVKKLYGIYDYDVKFNPDVTFIFGKNGCGKTTILNITEAIITGHLFKLFSYDFSKIVLSYAKSNVMNVIKKIIIESHKKELKIVFNDNSYIIYANVEYGERVRMSKNTRNISNYYFNHYEFLQEIKRTFNYVYLPLNRSYIPYDESDEMYYPGIHSLETQEDFYPGNDTRDGAMLKIESLIYQKYSRINAIINNSINNSFRDSILKSQIELKDNYDILEVIRNNDISKLKKTQSDYIKTLKELNLIDKSEEMKYNKFFTEFIEEFSFYLNDDQKILPVNMVYKLQEISKMQKTIVIAEKMEQQKATIFKPIETFLNTMNSFIGNSEDKKEICISNEGLIYFKTKYTQKRISIHHLSSGEKQLITFFTNLIFCVNTNSSGIFVVDEPELSLHLSWQKIFIDEVLKINKNIQLIFATHAPEIVGRRRDKMYRLDKTYNKGN